MAKKSWCAGVKGVLLDITGVLYNSGPGGGVSIDGSVDAVRRLKVSGRPVRFCTNETQCTRQLLVKKLQKLGFEIDLKEVFSPLPAACQYLKEHNLRPHLLVHKDARPEFSDFEQSEPNCVVLGDAADEFSYENVNAAFKQLISMTTPVLITMGKGKYYLETDGFKLDVGAYAAALEYACGVKPTLIGKPSKEFFHAAVKDMGLTPDQVIMVGDDIVNDVGGAQAAGLRGIQVRTGKYRASDESHPTVKPDAYVDNLSEAVEALLNSSPDISGS